MLPEDLSILVVSCDRYQDLWRPFFKLFWQHWPDCPFRVHLGSNFAAHNDHRVHALTVGEDRSWSENLRFFLNQLDTAYVLLLLEDFFLRQPVSTKQILKYTQTIKNLDAACLRLYPLPGPDEPKQNQTDLGLISTEAPYRVSTQPAIWNRQDLLTLLCDGETAWDFEINGSNRSRIAAKPLLATYEPAFNYRHVVELGQWFWSAAKFYRKANIGCDFSARPTMTPTLAAMKSLNRFRKNMWT